MSLNSIKEV